MKKYLLRGIVFFLLLLGLGSLSVRVEAKAPDRHADSTVLDAGGYLSLNTIHKIDGENQTWRDTKEQLQVGVYIVDSLETDIETVANETFRKWKVGYAGTDNGVLLVIAVEDRKFRLETSDNASTVLPDVEAKRILDQSREFFRSENYNDGVLYIVDAIGDRFYGTDRAASRLAEFQEESQEDTTINIIITFVIIGFVILWFFRGRGGGSGPDVGDLLWILASSSDSFGGSDSYDSGGWSGGGGDGGGASSDW